MELTDGVVRLRPPEAADAGWIVEACRDPVNQRWLPGLPDPYGPADAEWWLQHCRRGWDEATAAPFLILDAETGAIRWTHRSPAAPGATYGPIVSSAAVADAEPPDEPPGTRSALPPRFRHGLTTGP